MNKKVKTLCAALLGTALVIILGHAIAVTPSVASTQSTDLPSPYVGVWRGAGSQNNGIQWSILIALTPGPLGSTIGTIAYPSIPCGGELFFQGKSEDSVRLRENLTHLGQCVDRGSVLLSLKSDQTLDYEWFYPNGRSGGQGSLARISQD
ncbi:MAG: hypothetical protein AAGF75_04065 [Cyanobacteria bacterium P01_H01_bin.130]